MIVTGRAALWLLLAFPLAELISILVAAQSLGALTTFLLLVLGAALGVLVLRGAGLAALGELRREARTGGFNPRVLVGASRLVVVGLLLITPGFVSDLVALALSFPAVSDTVSRRVDERRRPQGPVVVELEPEEYRRQDPSRIDRPRN